MTKRTVAILGASADRSKFGNKALRAHRAAGYEVYPVNPKGGRIEGIEVCKSLAEVPASHLDRVSLYLPPDRGLEVLDDVAAKGCDELWLNPGADRPDVFAKAKALGLNAIRGCSIVDLGMSPSEFGD